MKKDDSIYIWAGVIILSGVALLFYASRREFSPGQSGVTFSQVDNARKDLMIKKDIQRKRAEVENYKNAPVLDTQYRPVREHSGHSGLQLESAPNHAAADSGDASSLSSTTNGSLDFQINKTLVNQQRAVQMSAVQKQQFVEDYKKKALAMGYEVEINSKLEITKVKKAGSSGSVNRLPTQAPSAAPILDINQIEEESEEAEEE